VEKAALRDFLYRRVSRWTSAIESASVSREARISLLSALVAGALLALLSGCGDSDETSGSEQFRDQTKSALLDFGVEGDDSELDAANKAANEFLRARSSEDWEAMCAQLSRALVDKLESLATNSTGLSDTSCASFLETFTQLSAQELDETSVDAGSLRHAGKRGYLIYYGPDDDLVYAMQMEDEGGKWRVAVISAKPLS
jgi:hypothetical protein